MGVNIKVQGAVVGGDSRGLCASCENGSYRENAKNQFETWCGTYDFGGSPQLVRCPITKCSEYQPKGTVNRRDLEAIAWHITTDKKTGKVGFLTPLDRAKADPDL